MVSKKRVVKKKKVSKPVRKKSSKKLGPTRMEKALVENFVSLQKVMTNLSIRFDNLTSQISGLLELFEKSAKTLAEKDFDSEKNLKDNKKIIGKIDNLIEQNKIIARGLTLLHEPKQVLQNAQKPVAPMPVPKPILNKTQNIGEYQKSISSKFPKFSEK